MPPDRPGHRTPYDTRRPPHAQPRTATAPASAFEHPKTISHCGHADASITLNWYAHAMPGNDKQAADLLAAVMEHPEKAAKTV